MTGLCAADADAPVVRSKSYRERFLSPRSGWRIERALVPRCGEEDGGLVGVWIPVGMGRIGVGGKWVWIRVGMGKTGVGYSGLAA